MDDLPSLDIVEDIETVMKDDDVTVDDVRPQPTEGVPLEEPKENKDVIFVKPKSKKTLSEKQKNHLAKVREMNRARAKKIKDMEKEEKEKEKLEEAKKLVEAKKKEEEAKKAEAKKIEQVKEEEKVDIEEKEFEKFMKHYARLGHLRENYEKDKRQKEELRKQEAERKRQEAIKAKQVRDRRRQVGVNLITPPANPYSNYFG